MAPKKRAGDGKRVAVYARFSSENQRDESIDAQLRAVRKHCEEHGFQIVKEYIDRAKSATTDKRPEFQKMVEESALGLFDLVIVHKFDRFSRDRYDSAVYKRKLQKNGVRLFSVLEQLDGSPESIMMESVLAGMAEYYSKNLAREVRKGMNETALQCRHTGGIPPLGYDVDPVSKRLVVNEGEAMAVRMIFRLYNAGYGYGDIMASLNENGYKTKYGQPFGKNSLYSIIQNEKYSGVYVFNRATSKDEFAKTRNTHASKDDDDIIRIDGGVPAIVSKGDFEAARQRMEANRHRPGAYNAKENYLLSGLVTCGICGHAMTGNMRHAGRNKTRYVTYKCSYRYNVKAGGCKNREIRKEALEGFVLSEMRRLIFNDEAVPRLLRMLNDYRQRKSARDAGDAEVVRARLDSVTAQIGNIVGAIASGYLQPEFKQKLEELEEQKAACELQLGELSAPEAAPAVTEETLRSLVAQFGRFVAEQNIPECKKFVRSFVEKVVVFPERVEVVLKVNPAPGSDDGPTIKSEETVKEIRGKFRVA